MKENVDKHLESLVEKVLKQSTLDTPSFDFTANLMSRVESSSPSIATTYKPLISKQVWALIVLGFIGFVAYTFIVNKSEASDLFNNIDFSIVNADKFTDILNGFKAPKLAAYGVGLVALILLIQIPLLKNYFDKRISL
ncbi:MAG TPA: hypothetical protein VKZ98_01400 [Aquaticitalea sp.]|nr:hypothetical protein [Aquaticitalea sp.]